MKSPSTFTAWEKLIAAEKGKRIDREAGVGEKVVDRKCKLSIAFPENKTRGILGSL